MSDSNLSYDIHWLDIANRALALIGVESLTSFTDGTTAQRIATQLLPAAVSDVYSQHPWKCTRKRVQLAPSADLEPTGEYMYPYPQDFARLEQVACIEPWTAEKSGIVTSAEEVSIIYSQLPSLADDMPPVLANLVTLKLAALMTLPLTSNSTLLESLMDQYNVAYSMAYRNDNVPNSRTYEIIPWNNDSR